MTAIIGDLAEGLGCTVGLKATVTAISFVAVGTSLPGLTTPIINDYLYLCDFGFWTIFNLRVLLRYLLYVHI